MSRESELDWTKPPSKHKEKVWNKSNTSHADSAETTGSAPAADYANRANTYFDRSKQQFTSGFQFVLVSIGAMFTEVTFGRQVKFRHLYTHNIIKMYIGSINRYLSLISTQMY